MEQPNTHKAWGMSLDNAKEAPLHFVPSSTVHKSCKLTAARTSERHHYSPPLLAEMLHPYSQPNFTYAKKRKASATTLHANNGSPWHNNPTVESVPASQHMCYQVTRTLAKQKTNLKMCVYIWRATHKNNIYFFVFGACRQSVNE